MQSTLQLLKMLDNPAVIAALVAASVSLLLGFWSLFIKGRLNLLIGKQ
jgi:hypothetical protein